MNQKHAALFEVWGVEIESMIVDAATLDVRPIADELLRDASGGGEWVEDVEAGVIGWSNELVAHLIELKNVAPVPTLGELPAEFLASVQRANALLSARGARLLPTAMHPWMRPAQETRIWPHDSAPIYGAYDALFDCRRHGWANLQSVHLNLPFADEREFGRLMAAVRVALPLIPALAASSPIVEGRATGRLDNRLDVYRDNATRVPAMAGEVIPEPVFDYEGYRRDVLAPITQQLAAIGADPALLDQEWTNARGAIARFDRMAIEIRLIDAQECPLADLAVAAAVGGVVRGLVEERWAGTAAQRAVPGELLRAQLDRCIATGPRAAIDPAWAALLGAEPARVADAGALWQLLLEQAFAGPPELAAHATTILSEGTLAERVLRALGPGFDAAALRRVYGTLADCLASGTPFRS